MIVDRPDLPAVRSLCGSHARRLDLDQFVALVLDGKTFGGDEVVIALGITLHGQKKILGFVQTATENEPVCAACLREMIERGLRADCGLLCVIDGAKGLRRSFGSSSEARRGPAVSVA